MMYLERRPCRLLQPFVRSLWLAWDPEARRSRSLERVLPNGCMQLILNLAGDVLHDVSGPVERASAPALIVGTYRNFQTIAVEDLEDLAGVVLRPGGFTPLFGLPAHAFSDRETTLEVAWGVHAEDLRERLRSTSSSDERMRLLEAALVDLALKRGARDGCKVTKFTLDEIGAGVSISEIARKTGLSLGRLGERFRREVGVTPKTFDRIQRFQRVVQQINKGVKTPGAELALECGFFDQAHFSHEFRSFSGMSPTEYQSFERKWNNHVPSTKDREISTRRADRKA